MVLAVGVGSMRRVLVTELQVVLAALDELGSSLSLRWPTFGGVDQREEVAHAGV